MKMNTCPSPEATRQPYIRDMKRAVNAFYTPAGQRENQELERNPVSVSIRTCGGDFYKIRADFSHPEDLLMNI